MIDSIRHPAEVDALLGPKGAGKTTTLRSILGLTRARSGQITFDGAPTATTYQDATHLKATLTAGQLAVVEDRQHRLGQRHRIGGRNQSSTDRVAHDLAVATDIGRHDGQAGRAGLQQCDRIALRHRRHHEQVQPLQQYVDVAAGPLDRAVRLESFDEFAATFGDPAQPLAGSAEV